MKIFWFVKFEVEVKIDYQETYLNHLHLKSDLEEKRFNTNQKQKSYG